MADKLLKYDVAMKSTKTVWQMETPICYTGDENTVTFDFNIIDLEEADLVGVIPNVYLYMRDGSFFQKGPADGVEITGTTVNYTMKGNEGKHSGIAKAQLVLVWDDEVNPPEKLTSQMYAFEVVSGLENKVAVEVMIQDWTTLTREARTFIDTSADEVDALKGELQTAITTANTSLGEFDVALQNGIVATNIAAELQNLEATYAPDLVSMKTQLADTIKPVYQQIAGYTTDFTTTARNVTSYVDGYGLLYYVKTTSTGNCNFEINGLGRKPLYKQDKVTRATTGDLVISNVYYIVYNAAIDGFVITDLTPNQKNYNTFFRKEGSDVSPNIINGHPGNAISSGSWGCIISGGGNGGRENVIGGVEANVGTAFTNAVPLNENVVAIYSRIIGGYDNVANGVSDSINADHCLIREAATHSSINGGADHRIHAGDFSAIGGGSANENSSTFATISGGSKNIIPLSSQGAAIAGGADNQAGGQYSGITHGRYNVTSADYSAANGLYGKSVSKGKQVTGGGKFSVAGDAQTGKVVLRKQTTTATAAYCGFDGTFDTLTMPLDSTWLVEAKIVARRADADGESKAWSVTFMAINNATGNIIIVNPVYTVLAAQAPATDPWTVSFDVNSDTFNPMVKGEAGKTINWVMKIETVEVAG